MIDVGYVKDAHGIKGEIFVRLNAGKADWLNELDKVRLQSQSGEIKSFQIVRSSRHKDGIIFLLENIKDRNTAESLKGHRFVISEAMLKAKPGEGIYLHEILGFEVIDKKLGALGSIVKFSSNGTQDLLVLEYKGREILIPFVEPFIEKVNLQSRQIEMILPDGLIDAL
ncbi:MAG: 16S rRNA processing protein RimM [Bdellovibrionales bacterium RBG_16_40_8]|nr:MAG: 16S rRNA processing protein RimM [Bdellovibrionales bacterium RBG_16_40_8]